MCAFLRASGSGAGSWPRNSADVAHRATADAFGQLEDLRHAEHRNSQKVPGAPAVTQSREASGKDPGVPRAHQRT